MPIVIKLKDLRIKSQLTQRQVADELGIVEGNYRKLENNRVKSVSLKTVETLCRLFHCKPNDIFEITSPDRQDVSR
jgi:DNA-binding Xre family transcriptional regulator